MTRLGTAWAIYSRGCLALQTRLSKSAVSALVQARPLASSFGAALLRLAQMGGQGIRAGGVGAWKSVSFVVRRALALAKASISSLHKAGAHAVAAIGPSFAVASTAFSGLGSKAERWMAARAEQRAKAAEAAKAAKAAAVIEAAEKLKAQARAAATPLEAASRPLPASKVFEPPSITKAAASQPRTSPPQPEKASTTPTPATKPARQPRTHPFKGFGMRQAALAGLAAASVIFLVAAVTIGPKILPARATLTVPIPEKPLTGDISPNRAEDLSESLAASIPDRASGRKRRWLCQNSMIRSKT